MFKRQFSLESFVCEPAQICNFYCCLSRCLEQRRRSEMTRSEDEIQISENSRQVLKVSLDGTITEYDPPDDATEDIPEFFAMLGRTVSRDDLLARAERYLDAGCE